MKHRWWVRWLVAGIVAIILPACHHNTKSSAPPPATSGDQAAPAQPAPGTPQQSPQGAQTPPK